MNRSASSMTTSSLACVRTRISAASFIGRSRWMRADLVFMTSRTSTISSPSAAGPGGERTVAGRSTPDLFGCLDDQRELGDLLVARERVALDGGGEPALAGERQLVERDEPGRLV